MPLNATFTRANARTMHLKGCHFGTLVPQSPYVSLNSLAYLVQYVHAQAILYSLIMMDIQEATVVQFKIRVHDSIEGGIMLYLIIKLLLTIICWFLIFTLFNFILGKENNGVVRYINKLNSAQYMLFIFCS
ncbi:hypothetical protein D0501_01250 [Leuconostoc holzapfelii]|uniref:Uncharacterized protein n=1 Tax=Leuconostoc holzapfelii TaxID=434464 RepID=A0ABT2NXN7_9LACO|nr:hypothetical protein [Leuconostoc holzapfelii]